MELAPEKTSAGNKRANAVSQPANKLAKTTDSRMASQMGHFKLEDSSKRKILLEKSWLFQKSARCEEQQET